MKLNPKNISRLLGAIFILVLVITFGKAIFALHWTLKALLGISFIGTIVFGIIGTPNYWLGQTSLFCRTIGKWLKLNRCKKKILIRVCKVSGDIPQFCPIEETEIREFDEDEIPETRCILHKEQEKITVCKYHVFDNVLANPYCKDVENVFVDKGSPIPLCEFHVKPKPIFVYPPQIEDLHCGLGSFLWFKRIAWSKLTEIDAIQHLDAFLYELRLRGVYANKFFMWLKTHKEEHRHLRGMTPYVENNDGVSDLLRWNPRYWELFHIFIDRHVHYGIIPAANPLMNKRYCDIPYSRNKQGVTGMFSEGAMTYQEQLMTKTCFEISRITQDFFVKPMNEMTHKNAKDFHFNADWHKRMIDTLLDWIPVHMVIGDVSKSEGCLLHYTKEGQECGKPLNPEGETHGDPRWDRKDIKKCVLRELHGVSTLKSLTETEKMKWIKSKNQAYIMDEDGSGQAGDEKGVKFGRFRFASADQTGGMLNYALTIARKKKKRFIFSMFPPGFSSEWIEDYSVGLLRKIGFWERLDRAQKVYYKIKGME